MNLFIQMAYGITAATVVSLLFILRSSFGEARHTLSIIGAGAILIASSYILRTRFIRWGRRQVWLKCHQSLASFGASLVLIHSAIHPLTWHSWLTFLLVLLNIGTGIAVSFTARHIRGILLRCHLALAPILLLAIVLHGREKLEHEEFFPLTGAHDIPCAKCHTGDRLLFRIDSRFQTDLASGGNPSGELQWEFGTQDIPLSEDAEISIEQKGSLWLITDQSNRRKYTIQKDGDWLNIHVDAPYKAYTCLTCHVHNTPEIQFAHEIHGVTSSYNACLNCHQTTINGKKYGKRRANWDY